MAELDQDRQTGAGGAGGDFVLVEEPVPPARIEMARERLLLSRMYVDLIGSINDDYGFALANDSCTLRAVAIYVFYRTVSCAPARAAQIAQAIGLSRNVVNRRLQDLIRMGHVERVGNAYRVTDKVNVEALRERLERRVNLIMETASSLARLREEAAARPGEPSAEGGRFPLEEGTAVQTHD